MKLIRIFGIVCGVHFVALLLFVQPGCQSKPGPEPVVPGSGTGSAADGVRIDYEPVDSGQGRAVPTRPTAPVSTPAPRTAQTAEAPRESVSRPVDVLQPLEPLPVVRTPEPVQQPETGGTYTVKSGDSLWLIADRNGVSLSSLLAVNGLSERSVIQPGQKLVLPAGSQPVSREVSAPVSRPVPAEGTTTYKVRSGDSLSVIAARHKMSVSELKQLNGLSSDVIRIDQTLIVREGGSGGGSAVSQPAAAPAVRQSGAAVPVSGETHTVQSGETPGGIAIKYGVTIDELMSANNISDPRRLQVGQKLVIPGRAPKEEKKEVKAEEKPAPKSEPKPEPKKAKSLDEMDLQPIPIQEDLDDLPIIEIIPEGDK